MQNSLQAGNQAPDFTATNQDGESIQLSDYLGKKVAIYFYPKDQTPGCTKQACNLRDHYNQLQAAGWHILGISRDSATSHQRFIAKYNLPFSLLVDKEGKIATCYQANGYLGFSKRRTFLIDEKGVIIKIIDSVKVREHAEQILAIKS